MGIQKNEIARCGACRFYTPLGRRGGDCSQLGVPVQSAWTSCCLGESPFATAANVSDATISLAKIPAAKKVVVESASLPTGRFVASEKHVAAKLLQ